MIKKKFAVKTSFMVINIPNTLFILFGNDNLSKIAVKSAHLTFVLSRNTSESISSSGAKWLCKLVLEKLIKMNIAISLGNFFFLLIFQALKLHMWQTW